MAIKPKAVTGVTNNPKKLDDLAQKSFTFQQLESVYKAKFSTAKGELLTYLNDGNEVDAQVGVTLLTPSGKIQIREGGGRYNYDKDKIIELVESGKITVAQILQCASFNAEDLEKTVSTAIFNQVASREPKGISLTMTATPEFKEKIASQFEDDIPAHVLTVPAPKAKPESARAKDKREMQAIHDKAEAEVAAGDVKQGAAAKAKAAAAKAKALTKKPAKTADDDLDAILGGE